MLIKAPDMFDVGSDYAHSCGEKHNNIDGGSTKSNLKDAMGALCL